MEITREIIDKSGVKTFKIRAIRDRVQEYQNKDMNYKKGDIFVAKFIGSMVFFLEHGETSNFYDFEIIEE